MNLTEILNYRTHCPICTKPLCIKSENTFNNITLKKEGFRIFAGINYVDFNYDGTFTANENYNYEFDMDLSKIVIRQYCKRCVYPFNSMDLGTGTVILKYMKKKAYFYSFKLKMDAGTFEPELSRESFMQLHEGSYYFLDNNFLMGDMSVQKMKTIADRMKLDLTAKNINAYADAQSIRSLINMYAVFS